MTTWRGKLSWRHALFFVTVLGATGMVSALATVGCSSDHKTVPAGSVNGGDCPGPGCPVAPIKVGDGGLDGRAPQDAATTDAVAPPPGDGSTPVCTPSPNNAPGFNITFTSEAGPPPFVGGDILEGTYFQTAEVHYGENEPPPQPIAWPGVTLNVVANDLKYGAYTTDKKYVPITAAFHSEDASITITQLCPNAGTSLGPQPFSVVGNDLTVGGYAGYTQTFTKQ